MNTSNVAVTRLKEILQIMDSTKESMHNARNDMQHEYEMLGIRFQDRLAEQLENAVDRCCNAMSAMEEELVCCEEFVTQLIRIMEEYENIQLEDKLL